MRRVAPHPVRSASAVVAVVPSKFAPNMASQRILIVRVAALGDVARASALLGRIQTEQPDAEVTWLCSTQSAPLVRLFPGVHRIVELDEGRLFGADPWLQVKEVVQTWIRLAGRRFDLALLAHPDPRYRRLIQTIPGRRIRTLAPATRETREYVGDGFAALLDGGKVVPGRYPIADLRKRVQHTPLPADLPQLTELGNLILLVPGGAKNTLRDSPLRRWPVESYAELARRLLDRGNTVGLIGGKGDQWVRPAFAGTPVIDLIDRLDIAQTLRLMSAASAVVSHDTGPLHFAHLVRAKLIALFGPTVPERELGQHPSMHVLWGGAELACRPCYDGREYAQCSSNLCMQSISVQSVVGAVGTAIAR